jgi:hypothetical protein
LSHGELEARRIYDRRAREAAGGAGVVQAVGTNAAAETGAAIQLGDVEGALAEGGARGRGGRRGGAGGGGGLEDAQSFLESLRLPVASLEALAAGDFLYLMPLRARGRHGVTSPSGAVVGHENCYDLRVVDHRHTDPDSYFTLSDSGIVHVSGLAAGMRTGLPVFSQGAFRGCCSAQAAGAAARPQFALTSVEAVVLSCVMNVRCSNTPAAAWALSWAPHP